MPAMGDGAGVELPQVVLSVFGPWELAVFALGGLVLATAGALLPPGGRRGPVRRRPCGPSSAHYGDPCESALGGPRSTSG